MNDAQSRVQAGVPSGGQYTTTSRSETATVLIAASSLSPETREVIAADLRAQRQHQILQLEHLREDAERIAAERDKAERALADIDQRLADLENVPDNAGEPGDRTTVYQGPLHVDDVVTVEGYGTFHRVRPGVDGDQPYQVRVQVDVELTDEEAHQLAGLVGYAWSRTGGERLGNPVRDAPNSIILYTDSTKGRAYRHLADRFEPDLEDTVIGGSPVRRTDRSGPGTAGTRLVEGLGNVGSVELYYDSVAGN